jgi:thiol-disulfide isomerase/thioredoxin
MGASEVCKRMRRIRLFSFLLVLMSAVLACAQPAPSTPPSEGLALLQQGAQRYADAKSYDIELVEERTSTRQYGHSWNKEVRAAAEAPGDRSYYQGISDNGGAIQVTDGKNVWKYRLEEHRYTIKPYASQNAAQSGFAGMQEMALMNAKYLRRNLADLAKPLKSAECLPDETLTVNGQKIPCRVIRVQSADRKRERPGYLFERTIWIDSGHGTILKTVEHAHSFMFSGTARIPMDQETVTSYTKTVLDGAVPDSLFTFTPPSDARLIQDFSDPMESAGASMTGDPAPALKFKSADGKVVALESFRGKPVLLDFWATWCAPCVAAMPQLAQIYQEAKDKGLVLLTVDQDEDAAKADSFLEKKGVRLAQLS